MIEDEKASILSRPLWAGLLIASAAKVFSLNVLPLLRLGKLPLVVRLGAANVRERPNGH